MGCRRVLVTGGAGFVGSHLVDGLLGEGFDVVVLDDLSTGRLENVKDHLIEEGFRFIQGDIRDREVLRKALEGVDAVFHLAAITSVPYSVEHPDITFEVNVEGTRSLLESCLDLNVGRFIYVSTCAVYGNPKYLPIDEEHPTEPISPYAESKLEAEGLSLSFYKDYGLDVTVFRPFNVYGPRQRNDQYGGVIARFIERLSSGKPPVIYGDGSQTRDFIYVEDVVRAFIGALNCEHASGRVLNVATGNPTSIKELAYMLMRLFGADEMEPLYRDAREGDIEHSYADISEAKNHLGFVPEVSLKEGLMALINNFVG